MDGVQEVAVIAWTTRVWPAPQAFVSKKGSKPSEDEIKSK